MGKTKSVKKKKKAKKNVDGCKQVILMSLASKVEGAMNVIVDITAGSYKMGRRVGKRTVDKFSG